MTLDDLINAGYERTEYKSSYKSIIQNANFVMQKRFNEGYIIRFFVYINKSRYEFMPAANFYFHANEQFYRMCKDVSFPIDLIESEFKKLWNNRKKVKNNT